MTQCAHFPSFRDMHHKRTYIVKKKNKPVGHWSLRIDQNTFACTSSQPSEGWIPVGYEGLGLPDLWCSFTKCFSISVWLTGIK